MCTGWRVWWAPQPQAAVLAVLSGAALWLNGLAGGLKPDCAATADAPRAWSTRTWAYTGVVMSESSQHRFPSRAPTGAGAVRCSGEREGPGGVTEAHTADSMCCIMDRDLD